MSVRNLEYTGGGITVSGAATGVYGMFQGIEWLSLIGVLIAVGGFLMNWHYSRQRNEREKAEHEMLKEKHVAEMEKIRRVNIIVKSGDEDAA